MDIWDDTVNALGEGPLWHPLRRQLFWFDIKAKALRTRERGRTRSWTFGEQVSAAAWVDETTLLIASETRLFSFDVERGTSEDVVSLEADIPGNRSNDGRADPFGGFWIGTMSKTGDEPSGAFWRYYRGELRRLYGGLTIPNACCFAPDGGHAYFCDTADNRVMRVRLDARDGWPAHEPDIWLDLSGEAFGVDGAVIDADGNFWNARWNGWGVACHSPEGRHLRTIEVPAAQTTCPAFGGDDLTTLFITSAADGVSGTDRQTSACHGMTFAETSVARGQPEHRVIL